MSGEPWDVPIGGEHPSHPGWVRQEASPFRLTFQHAELGVVEVDLIDRVDRNVPRALKALILTAVGQRAFEDGRRAAERDALDGREPIWRWEVPADQYTDRESSHYDIATEYVVVKIDVAPGVMLIARYGHRWVVNPWSSRPVIAELLRRLGVSL